MIALTSVRRLLPNLGTWRVQEISTSTALLAVFVVGFLVRVWCRLVLGGLEPDYQAWAMLNYYGGMSGHYLGAANDLADGRYPDELSYPILYPLFVALLQVLGLEHQDIRLVQGALDAGAALLLFAVLRRLGALRIAALFGALLYAIFPIFASGSVLLIGEAMVPAATILVAYTMVRTLESQRALDWVLLGLAGLVPALCRSELIFVAPPIVVWALLFAKDGQRIKAALIVAATFAIPCLLLSTTNYFVHGHFGMAKGVFFYAIAAGLGQFPNEFGYYTNDVRAAAELQAHGMAYHSKEAELYWREMYFNAWRDHPGFMWETIGKRIQLILLGPDIRTPIGHYNQTFIPIWWIGPTLAALMSVVLGLQRRWAALIIMWGPAVVAVASLGFVYAEPRYVRYAAITYIFAAGLALDALLQGAQKSAGRFIPQAAARGASIVLAGVAVAGLLALTLEPLADLRSLAVARARVAPLAEVAATQAVVPLDPAKCSAVSEGVTVSRAPLTVRSTGEGRGYQAVCDIQTTNVDAVILRYNAGAAGANFSLGLLRSDGSAFLSQRRSARTNGAAAISMRRLTDPTSGSSSRCRIWTPQADSSRSANSAC